MNKELLVTGAKIAGAALVGIFTIGAQEAALNDLRNKRNAINKARENNKFYSPAEMKAKMKLTETLQESFKESFLAGVKESALATTKEVVNIAQLGVVRSAESFIQEEQRELLRRQNGIIHRINNKRKQ